uniref:BHLH domain-containing protein n=1 Tax=Periophthalmus magnuspinnatus TaxID=409849 RepID=A0A3B4AZR8_9GOBI
MPGVSSTAPHYDHWDMDHLDHYQHYFYDDPDEDFFKSTAPSEDIWKKFELVPTPPMSPIRAVEGSAKVGMLYPTLGDKLEWVSQFLGQDDEEQDTPCRVAASTESFGNLSSIIIQDCMWSGFSAGQHLERVVAAGERQAKLSGGGQCGAGDAPSLNALTADCVDPGAVFTFPLGGVSKKQVSSGSESHSESSEEDEEEIDVVTVEHKQQKRKPRRLVNSRKPVTITVRADPLDLGLKRFHISIHQQQHNYAAPSPDSAPAAPEPPRKRVASSPTSSAASPSSPSSSSQTSPVKHLPPSHLSSPQSSDCEDTDKRKAHNFLERKRRNDLRSRFLSLRDEIPGLADCPKTPKVAILTRATEYLQQLHMSEKQKSAERKQLKAKRLQLLHRLAQLKRS